MMGRGCKKAPLSKISNICHTYPTLMKIGAVVTYLQKIQKIQKSRDTPLSSPEISIFFTENQPFLLYQQIQIKIAF